ncbi:hypothetical protein V2H77_19120 [Photorhabdus sp. P32]
MRWINDLPLLFRPAARGLVKGAGGGESGVIVLPDAVIVCG